jgi:hypothetical protein
MTEDAKTYLGRAYHARMGAKEATRAAHRAVFERLAVSYEKLAREVPTSKTEEACTVPAPHTFD